MHSLTRTLTVVAILVSLPLFTGHARAEGTTDPATAAAETVPGSASMRVDVGMFSPIGALGVVYSRPVHRLAAVELGAGVGFSGVLLSGMTKLRAGSERTKFTPGIGLSLGLPMLGTSAVQARHDDEMRGASVAMGWLDVDLLGVEHRTRSGVVLSASGGVTVALTEGHWDAADLGGNIHPLDVLPQFRLGVGKAF